MDELGQIVKCTIFATVLFLSNIFYMQRSSIVDLGTKQYHLDRLIGEGTYSKVYLAIKKSNGENHKQVACKIIHRRYAGSEFIKKFLPREISVLREISHPSIINVLDIVEIKNRIYIFMNYCKYGDMLEYVRNNGALSEKRSKYFFRQIVSAIKYLHALDISHRDLKCENIFLSGKHHVKLGDFGFARYCRDEKTGNEIFSTTFCGSAAYAAPEIIKGLPYNPKFYDIWSMGCILYIMLTAQMPFDDSNVIQMLKIQQNRTVCFNICYEMNISNEVKKLLVKLLEPDVIKRATIGEVRKSKWFSDNALKTRKIQNSILC